MGLDTYAGNSEVLLEDEYEDMIVEAEEEKIMDVVGIPDDGDEEAMVVMDVS